MAALNPKNILLSFAYLPVIPITFIFLGYLGYGYYTFTTSETSDYSIKIREIQSVKASIEVLKKKRKDQDQFYLSLEERKNRLREISAALAKTKSLLSEEMDLPSLQKLILTEAQRAGLTVQSWQPGAETITENYVQRSFDLEVKGLYFRLLTFFQRMANSSKIIRIEEFDLTAPHSNPNQKYVDLVVKMKMLAYRYNASKADDIANDAAQSKFGSPVVTPPSQPQGGVKK